MAMSGTHTASSKSSSMSPQSRPSCVFNISRHLLQLSLLMLLLLLPTTKVTAQDNSSTSNGGASGPSYTVATDTGKRGSASTGVWPRTVTVPPRECWLQASSKYRETVSRYLSMGAKLIQLNINFPHHPADMLDIPLKDVYQNKKWMRSSSRQGRSLLMLDEDYEYMSLQTLTIGVEQLDVNLTDHPPLCLRGKNGHETLLILRKSFLHDLKIPSSPDDKGSLSGDEHICNQHILPDDGHANFVYRCCHMNPDGELECEDMNRDHWITILMTLITLIKVLVVLYSPLFIPERMYRLKYVAAEYIYHLKKPLSIKVVVTQDPEQFGEVNKCKRVRLDTLKNMEVFKTMVSNSRFEQDKVYEVKVKDVRMSVKARRLLARGTVPVTFMKILYNNLLRCRIRKFEALRPCCDSDILGRFNPGTNCMKWHHCMRLFARACLMVILAIPWIIRVWVYFEYELDITEGKEEAAARVGLDTRYPGSVVTYLTPVHVLFLFIYLIFIIDSVVYGIISKPMKEKFNYVVRQCLRDMRERSRLLVLSWMTKLLVMPFRVFGIVGFLLFIPYLAILLIITVPIMAFYIFPTLNLSVRLIINLFIFLCPKRVNDKFNKLMEKTHPIKERFKIHEVTSQESFVRREHFSQKGIVMQMIVIIMCLISFWSLTLLIMEIFSFFVELLVYTFMGVIVNAGVILQYVTVLFLLFLYSKSTFSHVHLLYQAYHKVLHNLLLSMKRGEIEEVAKLESTDQENTCFQVEGEAATNKPLYKEPFIKIKEKVPQWLTSGMLVFLDRQDTPYTPEKFFFETIDLNYFGSPGPIYRNVVAAMWDFLKIVFFLLFIFIVVMAFGDAYQVSTTNQLLATVVGGFVPFLFRYIFKPDTDVGDLDTDSIQFRTEFHKVINAYTQAWNVFDIIPVSVREWDGQTGTDKEPPPQDGNGSSHPPAEEPNGTATPPDSGSKPPSPTAQSSPRPKAGEASTSNATGDLDSSTTPLLSGKARSSTSSAGHKDEAATSASGNVDPDLSHIISFDDDDDDSLDVDIIVDMSTSKTRGVNALLTKGFERGSVSMLDRSPDKSNYMMEHQPYNERPIDV